MFALDAGRAASRALHRAGGLLHAHMPRTLEELQDAASGPSQPGYEIHHIVEQNSKQPGEDARINSRENLVRIPVFKHHQITGYCMSEQREFGRMRPRDALRGTYWETGIRPASRLRLSSEFSSHEAYRS